MSGLNSVMNRRIQPERLLYFLVAAATCLWASCSRSMSDYDRKIGDAEKVMRSNTDSALSMLEAIDPADITVDSLRAKYHYLKAYGHMRGNRSMIGDSLVAPAHQYYSGRDVTRDIRSGMALAWYRFWIGDTPHAISMLDSLADLPDVPDSLIVQTLRMRVLLGASEYQGREMLTVAKRLESLETDSLRKIEAGYMLLSAYEYAGELDSALCILDGLIAFARDKGWGDKHFLFEMEKSQLMTEQGRNAESDALITDLFRKAGPDNGAADLLHFQYAINALNTGDISRATRHLAIADSLAFRLRGNDDAYFRSYSNLLHAIIDFRRNGCIKLAQINGLNNRQNERFNRMQASQWESERAALRQQNRALALKAESGHKTVIILIIGIAALLTVVVALWSIVKRRQRERENEERIEALQKMVDDYKTAPSVSDPETPDSQTLRSVLLKHLGIIRMVAETPTEQNREMLRKISSIDGETNGGLVDWENLFKIIDNLYSGFYSTLHERYGDVLSPKEEQIIVLGLAGFSTKEISVITAQTTSTVYVRKSSIRKKLGVPGKEDIVRFLLERRED